MTDTDNEDDLALLANITIQRDTLQHSLEQVAGNIDLYVNANKA